MISPYLYDIWPFLLLIFSPLETADFFMLLRLQVMAILCCVAKNSLRGTLPVLKSIAPLPFSLGLSKIHVGVAIHLHQRCYKCCPTSIRWINAKHLQALLPGFGLFLLRCCCNGGSWNAHTLSLHRKTNTIYSRTWQKKLLYITFYKRAVVKQVHLWHIIEFSQFRFLTHAFSGSTVM